MRRAIWNKFSDDLQMDNIEIDVSKEDAKKIWEKLSNYLPTGYIDNAQFLYC